MKLSISEILKKTSEFATDDEKKTYLLSHKDNSVLLLILKFTYNKQIVFLLPDVRPPWKKTNLVDTEGRLYSEARRLKIFVQGGGYDNLNQAKRELLFIQILESINDDDAEILCQMIERKGFKGITEQLVKETFPQIF